MTAMWKPGTAKPKSRNNDTDHGSDAATSLNRSDDTSDKHQHQHQHHHQSTTSTITTKQSKKLSGATMGMRFMQRKSLNGNNKKNNDDNKQQHQHHQNKQIDTSTAAATGNNTKTNQNHIITTNTTSSGIKRDLSNLTSNTETSILIQSASTTDIYGPHSDIIGRRSYNNYRKCIANTWETAYNKRENNLQNKDKKKISDEELLKRYQCYVNQRGEKRDDVGGGGESRRKRKTVSS
eukprot:scaffold48279_cov50-Cyclotella_meneghiniana.AAC.1